MKKLSKEEQIEILEKMLTYYPSNYKNGICGILFSVLKERGVNITSVFDFKPRDYIKGFTVSNARALSSKYGFKTPDGKCEGYWWFYFMGGETSEEWNAPRIAFIKALISELKTN